jgi:hypothetical protein
MQCHIYGIKIDCIYTDRPFPATKLFKRSEPLEQEKAQKTIWTDSIVNNYFQKDDDQAWGSFPVPWIDKPKPKLKFEHCPHLLPEGVIHLAGPAGAGKTTLLAELRHLDPLYITPTKKLRDDKQSLFRQRICMAGTDRLYSLTGGVRPSIMIIDEIGMISGTYLAQHIAYAKEHKVRLFLLGDQAQIRSQYSLSELWNTVREFPTVTFTINQRAKTLETRQFLHKMHLLAMYDDGDQNQIKQIVYQMRVLIRASLQMATKEDRESCPIISYHGKDDSATTIDKYQGRTVPQGTKSVIVFQNGGGRQDVMHKIIYTMVSRFEDIADIRYFDTSFFQDPRS